ncbi:MAG: hypothetical protein R2712_05095 [Vicinamibacterales bacterium]
MNEYLVNGQPISSDSGPKTWGDLLQAVDARAAAQGDVVTAVRFKGVDQPTFRGPEVEAADADALGPIEVETTPRARLLTSTLGTAGHSLPELADGARRAADAFRRGDTATAHARLSDLLATVRTLVELTLAVAAAAGTDLEHLPCGTSTAAGILGTTGVVLDGLSHHQRAEDWVALADELEYDLAPALLQWSRVFEALQERCAA